MLEVKQKIWPKAFVLDVFHCEARENEKVHKCWEQRKCVVKGNHGTGGKREWRVLLWIWQVAVHAGSGVIVLNWCFSFSLFSKQALRRCCLKKKKKKKIFNCWWRRNSWRHSELRSCVKVEVDVLGSPSLIVPTVSVDVKQHWTRTQLPSDLRSCVKVEVAVLGSQALTVLTVSVDVKQHWTRNSSDGKPARTELQYTQGGWKLSKE